MDAQERMTIAVGLVERTLGKLSERECAMLAKCANLEWFEGELLPCAWPGMYPLYWLDSDNSVLCHKCANESALCEDQIPSFLPVAADVNWEDDSLYCDNCNARIESAYGENQETNHE